MSKDWKMRVYRALPIALQELALSAYARHLDRLYYGPIYETALRSFQHRSFACREDVEAWQTQHLLERIAAARQYVPYYREKLAGCEPIHDRKALQQLPLLGKQEIRRREHLFLDERFTPRNLHSDRTSGTTGTSLTILWDKAALQQFWAAYEIRVRQAVGLNRFVPRAMLGGRPVVAGNVSHPPFWRYNRHWRQLYLSSYHISPQSARGYIEAIRRAGSEWLTGYGSAIAALAEFARAEGLPSLPLKAVVVSGDTLLPGMRKSIESFFQCRCYDQYGQCEGVCWIMECPHRRMHVVPEFGILEILDEAGHPCPPGVSGEMVATGLLNQAMPLIRYRMGDEAAWAPDQHCPCGQPFPIVERIEGRIDDYVVTEDGRKIGRLSTALKGSPSVHSAQIVQDRPGHAWLLLKPGATYRPSDAEVVKADILQRIGAFKIDALAVDFLPRTAMGKTKLVVRLEHKRVPHRHANRTTRR